MVNAAGAGHVSWGLEGPFSVHVLLESGHMLLMPHFPQTFLGQENCFLRALKYCP